MKIKRLNLKTDFYNLDEILNYNFLLNQEVNFYNIKYFINPENNSEIHLIKELLSIDDTLEKKMIKWEYKLNELYYFVNDKEIFSLFGNLDNFKNYKEYKKYTDIIKSNSDKKIRDATIDLSQVYLNDIEKEIRIEQNKQEEKIEKKVNLNIDYLKINSSYQIIYSQNKIIYLTPKLKNLFYGTVKDKITGTITNIKKENGEINLYLSDFKFNYKKYHYYPYLISIYSLILLILLIGIIKRLLDICSSKSKNK